MNARLSKEQVSSIYSLIRFEYPDLIEDKHRAFSFFDRLDFTQKELQELIVISNEIRVELTRERVHKSDGNRSPWQLFCAQYRSRFPSVSNRDFVQFYECITQISLQLPEELNVEKNVLNFISDVKKAYGNQTDQERILLQLILLLSPKEKDRISRIPALTGRTSRTLPIRSEKQTAKHPRH